MLNLFTFHELPCIISVSCFHVYFFCPLHVQVLLIRACEYYVASLASFIEVFFWNM